jgi:hypothetical protein
VKNAAQWLDIYKKRAGFRSDYALARYWGVSQSHISQYRRGRLKLPLAAVLEMAATLERDPLEILVSLAYPKARPQDRPKLAAVYWSVCIDGVAAEMCENSAGGRWYPMRRYR